MFPSIETNKIQISFYLFCSLIFLVENKHLLLTLKTIQIISIPNFEGGFVIILFINTKWAC
jgi:hypothetical protein